MSFQTILQNLAEIEDIGKASPKIGADLLTILGLVPRYLFTKFMARGGEALIMLAEDTKLTKNVVIKLALPEASVTATEAIYHHFDAKKNMPLPTLGGEKLRRWKKVEKPSEFHERFLRGCDIQQMAHKIAQVEAPGLGYIPDLYDRNSKPLFAIMEYIDDGEKLPKWIVNRDKIETLQLFHKMLCFVEKVLHDHSLIHSDLKPDNWLVLPDGRLVLLERAKLAGLVSTGAVVDELPVTSDGQTLFTLTQTPSAPEDVILLYGGVSQEYGADKDFDVDEGELEWKDRHFTLAVGDLLQAIYFV
jgi:serine/threonine protein kinase